MTTYSGSCVESGTVGVFEGLFQQLQYWLKVQQLKAQVSKERMQLLEMSDAMLCDMGITRTQVKQEAQRQGLPETRLKALNKEIG